MTKDMDLRKELTSLLNRHSAENGSNTPDFILADLVVGCVGVFNAAVRERERWYGRADAPDKREPDPDAKALWKLLDDIDTADDRIKPLDAASGADALARFREFVMQKVAQRHTILISDGYKLSAAPRRERVPGRPGSWRIFIPAPINNRIMDPGFDAAGGIFIGEVVRAASGLMIKLEVQRKGLLLSTVEEPTPQVIAALDAAALEYRRALKPDDETSSDPDHAQAASTVQVERITAEA